MSPIFEYIDYRRYMQAFYDERKRTSAFTWREFSRIAGFSSSNYMKLVCDGKSRLSKAGVERVADAMELDGGAKEYFREMVAFADARDEGKRRDAFAKMQ
ncbi:MAG: TIGR02147 family protein, partial [Fibrobacter sp.]|nr:TIGR02147 family protein [Fibrobacter sp.]